MKRFTKISLILSGGFLLLGIVLCLTAYTMGGRVGDLSVSYDSEKHSFVTGDQIKVTEGEEQHFQNIENLDLNMGVGELTVCYGSGKDFVLRSVGTGKFFCEQNGTTLKVNSKRLSISLASIFPALAAARTWPLCWRCRKERTSGS